MKRARCSAVGPLLTVAICSISGCATSGNYASCGWEFRVYKPGVMHGATAALVQSSVGQVGLQGQAIGQVPMSMGPLALQAQACGPMLPQLPAPSATACTLDDLCRRMEAMERRAGSAPLPLPKAKD